MSRISAYNKMKSEVLGKAFDIDGHYGAQCPVKGTLVSMADGTCRPVETLRAGDVVSTGNTVITNEQRLSKILKVKTDCGLFRVSPEHKFIMADGTPMKAEELKKGDRIALDTVPSGKSTDLSEDELRFLGFYLADAANARRHDSRIPEIFVTVETDREIEYLKALDVDLNENNRSNDQARVFGLVNKSHPKLAEIINGLDGKLSRNYSAGEFRCIIEGYLEKDGCRKRNSWTARSADKELLVSLQYGCLVNGWRASLSGPIIRDSADLRCHPRPVYSLTINPNRRPEGRVRWVKEDGEDVICVLNLDGNHLYCGENHLHHNCWDFANYVMKTYYNGKVIHCGISGYVKDIANQRKSNGILSFMNDVGLNAPLEPGDICIWGECAACPLSHIAIYDHDNGSNAVYFLGQNQGGYGVTIKKIPTAGIIGVFRPKTIAGEGTTSTARTSHTPTSVLNSIPSDFQKEEGTFKLEVDKIKIREAPSVAGKDTGQCYTEGMSVKYDGYVVREGYVWISWTGASGKRLWMAAGKTDKQGRNTEPWGTFY